MPLQPEYVGAAVTGEDEEDEGPLTITADDVMEESGGVVVDAIEQMSPTDNSPTHSPAKATQLPSEPLTYVHGWDELILYWNAMIRYSMSSRISRFRHRVLRKLSRG